jgi:AcrR family transcriptional regulator
MTPKPARPRGRPTSEQAARLDLSIKEAALDVFLDQGFERAKMDRIAERAGTTKATLYARYPSKEELFLHVLRWATARDDWPFREPELPDIDDLEGALRSIADASVRRALHPDMVKLARIANSQSVHFPEIAGSIRAGWPRQQAVVDVLKRHVAAGTIAVPDADLAAELFLGMIAATPARLASFGVVRSQKVQRRHTEMAVRIFVDGLVQAKVRDTGRKS